jgi:cell division protein FtsW
VKKGHVESQLLSFVTLALVAFGLVMVYSATSASAAIDSRDPMSYLKRQSVYALLGLAAMLVVRRIDLRALRLFAPTLLAGSAILCAGVLVMGQRVNGARRWISFGPAAFQPSELAKVAVAIWAAAYLARHPAPRTLSQLLKPVGIVAGIFCLLILAEPDLGTAIAITVMLAAILLVSAVPIRTLGSGLGIAVALGLAAIWIEPYRRARVFSFIDPWRDPQGAGFQNVQAMIGLGSGGFFGVGLGQSVSKIHYLPEAHTDMIFAVIGEELGLIGTAGVVFAYAVFAYAGFRIALACRDPFAKRLAAGLTALVCGQAAINLAAVLGVAPLTGIPLPFVSYGGSSLIVQLVSVGILLNIAVNHAGEAAARVPDRSRGNRRPRAAGARGRGSASGTRRQGDARRVAGSARSAARS